MHSGFMTLPLADSGVYIWAITRLIVVSLLPVVTIFGNIYLNGKAHI